MGAIAEGAGEQVRAWYPRVGGIREVFHAHFTVHAYPMHTHDSWTLLIIDEGAVRYRLGRHEHGALRETVTLLPPNVPHDGSSAKPPGFFKRVLYLETALLDEALIGRNVDEPTMADAALRRRVGDLHTVLDTVLDRRQAADRADQLELDSRLALICDRLVWHLHGHVENPSDRGDRADRTDGAIRAVQAGRRSDSGQGQGPDSLLARDLRDLLDANLPEGLSLDAAAEALFAHPAHLVRSFTRQYGMPPHRYLLGRRVDQARRLLLAGMPPAEAALASGFYDQAHLNRHFKRLLGVTPGRYNSSRSLRK